MFIVSIEYKVDLTEIDNLIPKHIEFLDKFYSKGNFLASGRKVPRTGGVILATANSREELESILTEDPFYENDIANYEITEFIPSKYSENLSEIENFT